MTRRTLRRVSPVCALALLGGALLLPLGSPLSATHVANASDLAPRLVATVPGTPGTPQAPTPVYRETFENAPSTPIALDNYTSASGGSYVADPGWLPVADQCNGWVLNDDSPMPADDECSGAWARLGTLARAVGALTSPADPSANEILSAYTNNPDSSGATTPQSFSDPSYTKSVDGRVMFQTGSPITTIEPGHYYTASAVFGAVNCWGGPSTRAQLSLSLLVNQQGSGPAPGTGSASEQRVLNATALDPCTGTEDSSTLTWTLELNAPALQVSSSVTSLGFRLENAQTSYFTGNDLGFDNPSLLDVTPQLDKAFSPVQIQPGGESVLTYTITNTTDLQQKAGWNFTDVLPAGITATSMPSSDCVNFAVAAANSSTTVVASGDLAVGQASCTISVPVTGSAVGTYTNGPSNFTTVAGGPTCLGGPSIALCGLNPPADATLTIATPPTPDLSVSKSALPVPGTVLREGQVVEFTLSFTNSGDGVGTIDYVDDLSDVVDDATLTVAPQASSGALAVSDVTGTSFSVAGPVQPGETVTVTYSVRVMAQDQRGNHRLVNFLVAAGDSVPTECASVDPLCTSHDAPVVRLPVVSG